MHGQRVDRSETDVLRQLDMASEGVELLASTLVFFSLGGCEGLTRSDPVMQVAAKIPKLPKC